MVVRSKKRPPALSKKDREEFYASGINDETIKSFGHYTESSGETIGRLLNRSRPCRNDNAGGLVFRVFGPDGKPCRDYCRVKLHCPRSLGEQIAKYESPAGKGIRIGFSPEPERIFDPSYPLVIVEGEKKGILLHQLEYAVITLTGVDCWFQGKGEDRKLHSDFDMIPLVGRTVVILFDTDEKRNPSVNRARCQLHKHFNERGAKVKELILPTLKGDNGDFIKVGVDDYIVNLGAENFHLIFNVLLEKNSFRSIESYRQDISNNYLSIIRQPGVHFDNSSTGSGKSYALVETLARSTLPSLIVLPTHDQIDEFLKECNRLRVRVSSYPILSIDTCCRFAEILPLIKVGISRGTICRTCPNEPRCIMRILENEVKGSDRVVCTHMRFLRCGNSLRLKRQFYAVHEGLPGILSPTMELDADFTALRTVVTEILDETPWLEVVLYCKRILSIIDDTMRFFRADKTEVFAPPRYRRKVGVPFRALSLMWKKITELKMVSQLGTSLQYCNYILRNRVLDHFNILFTVYPSCRK